MWQKAVLVVVWWCHQCRRSFSGEKKKASSFFIISFGLYLSLNLSPVFFPFFVNDDKKRPAFKCSGCFRSHLNRFLKTSVGELVLPFLPFETADFFGEFVIPSWLKIEWNSRCDEFCHIFSFFSLLHECKLSCSKYLGPLKWSLL